MSDIVERMRWWGSKRRPPRNMPTLPADCAEAADEIERLRKALELVRDGYGPNHLSRYALGVATAALRPTTAEETKG